MRSYGKEIIILKSTGMPASTCMVSQDFVMSIVGFHQRKPAAELTEVSTAEKPQASPAPGGPSKTGDGS